MRAIINGKRYDTEKATLIGEEDYGYRGDFSRWKAGLYKTPRSGRYFLAGEGGPMTQFAESYSDGTRGGGSRIIPMTPDDALRWAEQYLDTDVIEEHFSDMIEEA